MEDYKVSVANIFEADSPEDAVLQMVEWLIDSARHTGYRVINMETDASCFLDAEDIGG